MSLKQKANVVLPTPKASQGGGVWITFKGLAHVLLSSLYPREPQKGGVFGFCGAIAMGKPASQAGSYLIDCTLSQTGHLHPTYPVSASIDGIFSFTFTHFKHTHLWKKETLNRSHKWKTQQYLPRVKGRGRCFYIPVGHGRCSLASLKRAWQHRGQPVKTGWPLIQPLLVRSIDYQGVFGCL